MTSSIEPDVRKVFIESKKIHLLQPVRNACACTVSPQPQNVDNRELQKVWKQKSQTAEGLLTLTNKRAEKKALNNLGEEFIFDNTVVKQWSKHSTNYSAFNLNSLKTQLDDIKRPKRPKSASQRYYSKSKRLHYLSPIQDNSSNVDHHKSGLHEEKYLLGLNNSDDRMKYIPKHTSSDKPKKVSLKHIPKTYGWDEYVLSLMSKGTADKLVHDHTTYHQPELRTFIETHEYDEDKALAQKKSSSSIIASPTVYSSTTTNPDTIKLIDDAVDLNDVNSSPKRFENVLQESYPLSPCKWSSQEQRQENRRTLKVNKGIRKWLDYPQEIKDPDMVLQEPSFQRLSRNTEEVDLKSATKQRNDPNLLLAVDEWRSKWLLEKKWQEKSFKDIKLAIKSINDHVRLAAVSAAGKVIIERRKGRCKDVTSSQEEEMIKEIKKLYDDKSAQVVIATAITLFTINHADEKGTELLLHTVKHGAKSERWIAAQCLAEYDCYEDCVLAELLSHVGFESDPVKRKKVEILLQKLSIFTDSVQYMLAEQLNSTSWKDRYSACVAFPTLTGRLRKDIANKLLYLTWHDWNKEVRTCAAVALGKTGNGKLVHASICSYLKSPKACLQIEALQKISKLGIVTAQLMLPYLLCLKSSRDTVCVEAIRVARNVHLGGEEIIRTLVSLASSDRSMKIKVNTVKTLGILGNKKDYVRDCLLWALHFEKHHLIREAACEAILRLDLRDDDEIIDTMQEMLLVDENEQVKKKVALALELLGCGETSKERLIVTVRDRVKMLCRKNNMLLHVLADSNAELKTHLMQQQQQQQQQYRQQTENVADTNDYLLADSNGGVANDDVMNESFNVTLEAYRARNVVPAVKIQIPRMQSSYIPYWTESNQTVSSDKE